MDVRFGGFWFGERGVERWGFVHTKYTLYSLGHERCMLDSSRSCSEFSQLAAPHGTLIIVTVVLMIFTSF